MPKQKLLGNFEERHGSAGARRASGGVGGHVGAPPVPNTKDRPLF
jgi:hypothetical protein